ncbi:hypothetical protein HPB50_018308 [Hyalomma asiaticum]|uniref:Uncharacterized protein n=1 Tax=Hyalomma asiaticum TaxID=266040 RepID=A0ACB7SIS6_HYAAI|nr:hypothetical protein HPB50_018308 [Hyalomma asiaticum]
MDSSSYESGIDQSGLEVSTLTGTSGDNEGGGVSAVALIAIAFCGIAVVMAIVVALLFSSDLELFDDGEGSGRGGGKDDEVDYPTRYPPVSSAPAAVTDSPMKKTPPPLPITTRGTTKRPPPKTPRPVATRSPPVITPKPTPAQVVSATPKKTTRPPSLPPRTRRPPTTKATTPSPRTTPRTTTTKTTRPPPPPPTPPPPSPPPTPAPTPPPPPRPQSSIKPQSLLCTFGNRTNYGTVFPADGVCDYVFYDSMYKNNHNPLVGNWDYDVYSILSKAQKTDRKKTQFGLGFAFEHRAKLIQDLAKTTLEVFWGHGVFHFGILDCPAHGVKQADMDSVFEALKALDNSVQVARDSGNHSYVVLGAVANTDAWNNYYKGKFSSTFRPDLFISLGHQLRGDPEKGRCISTPPAILEKPQGSSHEHDLRDAVKSLASISSVPGGPRLSISVSMRGRWSKLLPASRTEIFSACEKGTPGPYFGSYTELCNTPPFMGNLLHEVQRYAMRTFDPGTRRMFVYDNEQTLCQKLCLIKANYTKVPFGVAAYDLDYEDTDDTCADLNLRGAYSRLQVVRAVATFFANKFTDPSKEAECSALYR